MSQNVFAYIRVSSKDQHEARQVDALAGRDIPPGNLFMDKQSGADFARPAYQRLLKRLRQGDLLIVKSIDRLGRSYGEILEQWRLITRVKQADILVLDMPLLDTRTRRQDLTGAFIADLVLQILSYVAQTERDFMRQRQAEGIAAARARGVRLGAEKKPLPPGFAQAKEKWQQGALSGRQAAALANMPPTSFLRRCREQ